MAKTPGSIWVEGLELHYIDWYSREWYLNGVHKAYIAALPGSIWMDPTIGLCYQTAPGNETMSVPQALAGFIPINAILGCLWIDSNEHLMYFSAAYDGSKSTKVKLHTDVPAANSHTDGGHTDTPHTDVAHTDIPNSTIHTDTFSDWAHADHTDVAHGDLPLVNFYDHTDCNSQITGPDGQYYHYHSDCLSTPAPGYDPNPYGRQHTDQATISFHNDAAYLHYDSFEPHITPHTDTHTDVPHDDYGSHNDHLDHNDGSGHSDLPHSDIPHSDAAHGDSHGDVVHQDQPIFVGA